MRLLTLTPIALATLVLCDLGGAAFGAVHTTQSTSHQAVTHQTVALSPFEKAERLHEALEGQPEEQRTRRDYERVLSAFRSVYHDDPASPRADASIAAVADLLAEEGRIFQDEKALHDAIGQYEFLRREYPGSRYRFSALLTEAEIYRHDLNDREAAKSGFQQFLKLYPQSPLADQARQGYKQIHAEEIAERRGSPKLAPKRATAATQPPAPAAVTAEDAAAESGAPARDPAKTAAASRKRSRNTVLTAAIQSQAAQSAQPPPPSIPARSSQGTQPAAPYPQAAADGPGTDSAVATNTTVEETQPSPMRDPARDAPPARPTEAALNAPPPPRRGRLPLVTGVRHWSTPVYTRVAIDLQNEVEYEAARVPDPDRIFFDLHGTRLSPELIGKSVMVTDDGFLKRIRVAQFSNEVTRVVLDVSDVSDYSAFLLPNPYRLIIDIHGRKGAPANTIAQSAAPATSSAVPLVPPPPTSPAAITRTPTRRPSPDGSALPPSSRTAPSSSPSASPDQATVPQSTQTQGTALQDIANLGHQPNKVKATRHPTTGPVSDSVAGTTPAPQPADAAGHPTRRVRETSSLADPGIHEAEPTAGGSRSLSRALGLKIGRIVVDAGHGGHDSGTLGPDGIEEKEVVLDVALRLGKLLKQHLGADVIFTRDDDTFVPLETRTAIANKAQADLFISVHANSSQDPTARGVETYYLNFTSSPDALEVAARENAVSQQSIHQLSDLVKKIALQDKIDESREFASDVEKNLYDGLTKGNPGLRDRGVKKAPFVVLIGANMPSILAEISFLTNPDDAEELHQPAYRQRIAESLYRGVSHYISGLSGVRLAESGPHTAGN